jgi:hypothetical protein
MKDGTRLGRIMAKCHTIGLKHPEFIVTLYIDYSILFVVLHSGSLKSKRKLTVPRHSGLPISFIVHV